MAIQHWRTAGASRDIVDALLPKTPSALGGQAAWLAAYDAALAVGVADVDAGDHADAAYRVAAIRAGLPATERPVCGGEREDIDSRLADLHSALRLLLQLHTGEQTATYSALAPRTSRNLRQHG